MAVQPLRRAINALRLWPLRMSKMSKKKDKPRDKEHKAAHVSGRAHVSEGDDRKLTLAEVAAGERQQPHCGQCGSEMGLMPTAHGHTLRCPTCLTVAPMDPPGGGRAGSKQSKHPSEEDHGSRRPSKNMVVVGSIGFPDDPEEFSRRPSKSGAGNDASSSSRHPSKQALFPDGDAQGGGSRKPSKQALPASAVADDPGKMAGNSTCPQGHPLTRESRRGHVCDIKGSDCKRKTAFKCGSGCDFDACEPCMQMQKSNAAAAQKAKEDAAAEAKKPKNKAAKEKTEAEEAAKAAEDGTVSRRPGLNGRRHSTTDAAGEEAMGGFHTGDRVVFDEETATAAEYGVGSVVGPGALPGVVQVKFDCKEKAGKVFNLKADGLRKLNLSQETTVKHNLRRRSTIG